jgi:uncharacterized delta-60 repeat protein
MNALRIFLGKAAWLALILSLLTVTPARAKPGDLDPTFGGDGKVTTDVATGMLDKAYAVAVQSDGKIVVAGESYNLTRHIGNVAVVRYNLNGTLDKTFNGTGMVVTPLNKVSQARDVAIQADGKIVVSGRDCNSDYSNCGLAVIRYTKAGKLDTSFHGTGSIIIRYGIGNSGTFGGLEIAPDGKIVIAGYAMNSDSSPYDFVIYRLNADGYLDPAFSGDGIALFNFASLSSDVAQDLVIQPDGKILAVGYTCHTDRTHCNFALVRVWRNGVLDNTFGTKGKQITDCGGEEQAPAVAIQADGKFVIAGRRTIGTTINMVVARYSTKGLLDKTFNGSGKKVINFMTGYDEANYDVMVLPNGKIVTLGYVANQDNNFAVVRLWPGGGFDATFGVEGKVQVNFGADDFAYGLALHTNGGYMLVGRTDDGTTQKFALARLKP